VTLPENSTRIGTLPTGFDPHDFTEVMTVARYTLPNGNDGPDGELFGDEDRALWDQSGEAHIGLVPKGCYRATLIEGGPAVSPKKGTKSYKLVFSITDDGPHQGRRLYMDLYVTRLALPMTKAQLKLIGITEFDQTQRTLEKRFECQIRVTIERDDDNTERNRVREFKMIRAIESPPWEVGSDGAGS
jgi:hypothetical protein